MKLLTRREMIPAVLVIAAFFLGRAESPFFEGQYLLNTSSLYVETGLLALGMTLVIICGQIDLSVASMLALVACVTAKILAAGLPTWVALPAGVGLGALLGAFNGVMVAKLKLPSFVVTLGTMAAYRGIAQVMLGAKSEKFPAALTGIDYLKLPGTSFPVSLTLLLVAALLVGLWLHRTVIGRWIYTVGTNERAAYYSGVPTTRVKILVFAASGLLAGLAGLHIDSRLGVARFDHARGLEVDVITAVVLGGASIYGGEGSIIGTLIALLLVALIRIGMGVANVTAEYQLAAIGSLLIFAVLVGNLVAKLSASRKTPTRRQPLIASRPRPIQEIIQ